MTGVFHCAAICLVSSSSRDPNAPPVRLSDRIGCRSSMKNRSSRCSRGQRSLDREQTLARLGERIAARLRGQALQLEANAGQRLQHAVVQVAGDAKIAPRRWPAGAFDRASRFDPRMPRFRAATTSTSGSTSTVAPSRPPKNTRPDSRSVLNGAGDVRSREELAKAAVERFVASHGELSSAGGHATGDASPPCTDRKGMALSSGATHGSKSVDDAVD